MRNGYRAADVFKQYVHGFGLVFALLPACAAVHPTEPHNSTNAVYLKTVESPALRQARTTQCEETAGKSIPDDTSSEGAMERSTRAGEQLLSRQQDCQYLSDFYAELQFAATHDVLTTRAWQSCLQRAPVGDVSKASEVGTYIECLRAARTAAACVTSGSGPDSVERQSTACARFIGTLKWQLKGEDWNDGSPFILSGPSNGDDSLFASSETAGTRPTTVLVPSAITLHGVIRTGFFVDCCFFGWEYRLPFSYIRLDDAVILSAPDLDLDEPARDIELDTAVPGSMIGKVVTVTCAPLDYGMTGHYAEPAYCSNASVRAAAAAPSSQHHPAASGSG